MGKPSCKRCRPVDALWMGQPRRRRQQRRRNIPSDGRDLCRRAADNLASIAYLPEPRPSGPVVSLARIIQSLHRGCRPWASCPWVGALRPRSPLWTHCPFTPTRGRHGDGLLLVLVVVVVPEGELLATVGRVFDRIQVEGQVTGRRVEG